MHTHATAVCKLTSMRMEALPSVGGVWARLLDRSAAGTVRLHRMPPGRLAEAASRQDGRGTASFLQGGNEAELVNTSAPAKSRSQGVSPTTSTQPRRGRRRCASPAPLWRRASYARATAMPGSSTLASAKRSSAKHLYRSVVGSCGRFFFLRRQNAELATNKQRALNCWLTYWKA